MLFKVAKSVPGSYRLLLVMTSRFQQNHFREHELGELG